MGWFGFNGGSQLAMGSKADIDAIAMVVADTNMAAVQLVQLQRHY